MKPDILLFGGGYSLSRAARLFPRERIVVTSTKPDKVERFQREGYLAARASNESIDSLRDLLRTYPSLTTVVDSAPPVSGEDSCAGVRNMMEVIRPSSIKRVVYLSTTGVFGAEAGEVVDEDTPPIPTNARSRTRYESEQMYRSLPCEVIALRIAGIYGPGRGIGTALKRGSFTQIRGGERWSNRIHVDDLSRMIAAVLLLEVPAPSVLCVADDEPALISTVIDYYCKTFGLAQPQTISREEAIMKGLHTMLSNQRVSNARMKQLVPNLLYPSYREGAITEFER